MRVKDLVKGQKYYWKTGKFLVEYCGVEYFMGHKYHNFFDAKWKLWHWINPKDVSLAQPVIKR